MGNLTAQTVGPELGLKPSDHLEQVLEGEMNKCIDIYLVELEDEKLCNFTILQWSDLLWGLWDQRDSFTECEEKSINPLKSRQRE